MESLRQSLTLYAYNIIGSWEDARDIVQDVFLKFTQVEADNIDDKKSYLIRMVVNLSIDRKRKLKKQLSNYAGPWLPEPISTDDPHFALHRKEILSYSLHQYLNVLEGGDMQQLERLLSHDITVTSDGGGKVSAFRKIISGVRSVGTLLAGLYKKMYFNSQKSCCLNQPTIFWLPQVFVRPLLFRFPHFSL